VQFVGLWIGNYYSFYFGWAVSCCWWLWTSEHCTHPSYFGHITSNSIGAGLLRLLTCTLHREAVPWLKWLVAILSPQRPWLNPMQVLQFFPCQHHSISTPYSFIHLSPTLYYLYSWWQSLNNKLEKVCAEIATILAFDTGGQPASHLVWTLPLCNLCWRLEKIVHTDMIYWKLCTWNGWK
jgi:hypothetical protein